MQSTQMLSEHSMSVEESKTKSGWQDDEISTIHPPVDCRIKIKWHFISANGNSSSAIET